MFNIHSSNFKVNLDICLASLLTASSTLEQFQGALSSFLYLLAVRPAFLLSSKFVAKVCRYNTDFWSPADLTIGNVISARGQNFATTSDNPVTVFATVRYTDRPEYELPRLTAVI